MRILAYLGAKRGIRIVMKFCVGVGVPDVITHANFGNDRFRGFRGAGLQFSTFPLTYAVVLNTRWAGTTVPQCDFNNLADMLTRKRVNC